MATCTCGCIHTLGTKVDLKEKQELHVQQAESAMETEANANGEKDDRRTTSHVLVSFIEEDGSPTAILPVKRVKDVALCDLEEGTVCQVEWSDKKLYSSQVVAIGE